MSLLDHSTRIDVSHLRIYSRDNRILLLNPSVPKWALISDTSAAILKLLSKGLSVVEVGQALAAHGVSENTVRAFCDNCYADGFFDVRPASGGLNRSSKFSTRKISSIHLHLTNKCNLSCSYCFRNSSPKISIKHSGADFIDALSRGQSVFSSSANFTFTGGEPMMHPDFFEVAEFTANNGWRNSLLSNGTYIDESNVEQTANLFGYIKISVDGASAHTHSETRGQGNFERVLKAIKLLSKFPDLCTVEAQMTVTQGNVSEAKTLKEMIPDNVRLMMTPLLPMGRGKDEKNEETLAAKEFYEFSQQMSDVSKETPSPIQPARVTGCYAGDLFISISDRGEVYPCHHFHRREFAWGNIFDQDFPNFLFEEKALGFALGMNVEKNNPHCSTCDFRYLCGGGCKANPLHALGSHNSPDIYCSHLRASMLDDLFASV